MGRNPDQLAAKRQLIAGCVTLLVFAVSGVTGFAYVTWQAAKYVMAEFAPDEAMVEVIIDDLGIDEDLPPPPPPPPPPPAAADDEEEEEEEEDVEVNPDEMSEEVAELDEEVEEEVKSEGGGAVGGVEGGVEGGVVGGVVGGVIGGVLGGQLGGVMTFHHSEVQVKRRVLPRYPEAAKELNLGDVSCRVRVFIDEDGVPYDFQFEACPKVFHSSASEALQKWRWYPAKAGGQKVKAQFLMVINYTLK